MCGILFSAFEAKDSKHEQRFKSALSCLSHRGPDGTGMWRSEDESIYAGHTRLAINDISAAGNQPMVSNDNRFILICNGEIYNYKKLRGDLEKKGYKFLSNSDSEILIHGYIEWGKDLLNHIQGMYAFCLWDKKEGQLFAARDHVGMKPLHYIYTDGRLTLASEVGALAKLQDNPQLNKLALAYVLSIGYVPETTSIWKNISTLRAGHALTWSKEDALSIYQHWIPPTQEKASNPALKIQDIQNEFETLFEEIVSEHLLSDVPICLFLSGGLDSTAIAVALSRLGVKVDALTINYADNAREEVDNAKEIASTLNLNHQIIDISNQDIEDLAAKTVGAYDQPQGYSALMSSMQICEVAGKSYKVALGGDGGDEIFGGYGWYYKPPIFRGRFFQWLYNVLPKNRSKPFNKINLYDKAYGKLLGESFARSSDLATHASRLFPRFLPDEACKILGLPKQSFTSSNMLINYEAYDTSSYPYEQRMQVIDLMNFCSSSILPKVDRSSMYYGLEVRTPFLDKRLIEWAFALPLEIRQQFHNKKLVKNYINKHLPEKLTKLPKQGFSVPIRNSLTYEGMASHIDNSILISNGIISPEWQQQISPYYGYEKHWILYFFSLWCDRHLRLT